MSLPHALLTSLIERPGAGADLARRFDRSIGYFWHATHQQIYRELGRMEAAGWIAGVDAPGRGRRREYVVLPSGRTELERWAAAEAEPPPPSGDALLVKLRAAAAIGPLDLTEEIRQRLLRHESQLELYQQIEERDFDGGSPEPGEAKIQHLVLRAGISVEEAGAEWCREAIRTLAQL